MSLVANGLRGGPFSYAASGKLEVNGTKPSLNPAHRFGVQLAGKLRAVVDPTRSVANSATAVHAPINLPSRDHVAQLSHLDRCRGKSRPLAIAKVGHADAYKRPPLLGEDEPSAAATLQHRNNGLLYGVATRSRVFGPAAAVLRYNCLSSVMNPLAFGYLEISRVGCCDDYGGLATEPLIRPAL